MLLLIYHPVTECRIALMQLSVTDNQTHYRRRQTETDQPRQ